MTYLKLFMKVWNLVEIYNTIKSQTCLLRTKSFFDKLAVYERRPASPSRFMHWIQRCSDFFIRLENTFYGVCKVGLRSDNLFIWL